MSAESGISTFRDANGLWENHDIMDVASPVGFRKNPDLVYEFYNQRRRQLKEVLPNNGHKLLASLQKEYNIHIITQNVDDLHERAGSTKVTHLHGELRKARSCSNEEYIVDWHDDLTAEHKDPNGNAMRPHIVWFGEAVPMLEKAIEIISTADIVLIIGTSLNVYPAASLYEYAPSNAVLFYIDPKPATGIPKNIQVIAKGASEGIQECIEAFKSL